MSRDGIRKMTKGWEINSSGKMVNITGGVDGIVVDEGLPVTDSAVVKTEPPPLPGMARAPVPPAPMARAPIPPAPAPRAPMVAAPADAIVRDRKSTLETFNDELSVLERPIESEVEYFDEAAPPARWRRAALFAGVVIGMGLAGGFVMSRRHATVEAPAQAATQPAPAAAAPAPTVLAATAPAAAAPAAPSEPAAPAAAPAADDSGDDAEAEEAPAPAAKSAWSKVRTTKSGHAKHARSSGKSSRRHAVASKRSSRHH